MSITPESEQGSKPDVLRELYQQALECAQQRREAQQALIALGHCHVRGGQVSADSERRIVIGGAEALPVEIFDTDISYVALGHLHRAQCVAQQERVRYAGSPLPMSFSEINYLHQVLRVDLHAGVLHSVTALRVPRRVEMLRIPQQAAPLAIVLEQLSALQLAHVPLEEQPYLQVRVQQTTPDPSLRSKVEAVLAKQPVRLVRIETSAGVNSAAASAAERSLDDVARLQPLDIFQKLYHSRHLAAPSAELCAAFDALLAEVSAAETGC